MNRTLSKLTKKSSDPGNTVTDGSTLVPGAVIDTNAAPAIRDLKISGKLNVDEKLSASYTFDPKTGVPGDASTYLWGQAGTATGVTSSTTAVSTTGVVPAYTIKNTDAGKVLEVSVRAKNKAAVPVFGNTLTATTANSTGTITDGGPGGVVIDTNAAPAIRDLKISGKLNVDEKLSASYVFDPKTGERTDVSTYLWGQTGTATGVTSSTTAVSTTGVVPAYTIKNTDAGKVLEVSVRAKNKAAVPVFGNILTKKSSDPGNTVTDGSTLVPGAVIDTNAAPAIRDLKISGKLNVDEKLSASYTFDPKTGVPGDASTYLWGQAGTATGVTSSTTAVSTTGVVPAYTIKNTDAGKVLEVSVRAKNKAAVPVFGNILTKKSSDPGNTVTDGGPGGSVNLVSLYIQPIPTKRNWADANNYCRSQSARLPSRDELQRLFRNATSGASPNTEMCSKYEWPLSGQCRGSDSYYWSGTPDGTGTHWSVNMTNGNANSFRSGDSYLLQVACVR